ncbi:MAG: CARDB domain-containing protein [Kiloniellaceae bacterium]
MAKHFSLGLLAAAGLTAALSTVAGTAAAQPNLVPVLSNPMNASVGVQNLGATAAGPSHLTINCTRFGEADGGCPDIPGLAAYADPAFPNRVVVDVPALEPGESFNHNLAFWAAIPWTPGTYVFDAVADAGNAVAESNEADNTSQSSYTQLPAVGVAPQAPLPLAAQPVKPQPPKPAGNAFVLKQGRSATAAPQQPAGPQRLAPTQPSEPKRLMLRTPDTRPAN